MEDGQPVQQQPPRQLTAIDTSQHKRPPAATRATSDELTRLRLLCVCSSFLLPSFFVRGDSAAVCSNMSMAMKFDSTIKAARAALKQPKSKL